MTDYRTRIYRTYASGFQEQCLNFNPAASLRWGRAYDYYFKGGWMPRQKDAAIVDLACGGGKLLYFFKQRGFANLSGVDISPEQVSLARQVTPNVTEDNVLDFLKNHLASFDLITGLDIIEHLQKDEVLCFLDGCHSALKPGGRLILQTPNGESLWVPSIRYGDFTHEVCFSPGALEKLLRLSAFVHIEVREQGPVPWGYNLLSTVRYAIWKGICSVLKLWNIVETGSAGSGVFTRVFLISGCKQ